MFEQRKELYIVCILALYRHRRVPEQVSTSTRWISPAKVGFPGTISSATISVRDTTLSFQF